MLKCYARIFAFAAFFFFLGSLAANMNMYEGIRSILDGLTAAMLFGAATAGVMGTLHVMKAREAAGDKAEGDIYSMYQTREVRLSAPYDRAFHAVSHYISEVAHFRVLGADAIAGVIEARVPAALFRTTGSKFRAELRRDGEGTVVTLTVAPVLGPGLADYGRNLRLVLAAAAYLEAGGRA